jgi:uncharacterized phage-associated protein
MKPMLIEHNREKLLNAIIYFLSNTKYCGKTKLFKLLYYLDFMHFRETGRSVTGLDYYAWQFGPYPTALADDINTPPDDLKDKVSIQCAQADNNNFTCMKPRKKFDDTFLTKRELRILENVAFIFKDAKADDMVEASHLPSHPWDKTINSKGEKAKIDYTLALDGSDSSLSLEEVLERLKDKEELKKALNG